MQRKGPVQLQTLFKQQTGKDMICETDLTGAVRLLKRSAFGLVPLYNRLPNELRIKSCVRSFQTGLQALVKEWVYGGVDEWRTGLSPRGDSLV